MDRHRELFEFGKFRLDPVECALFRENRAIPLEPQVYKTLLVLVENAGRLVGKGMLLDAVWGDAQVEEGNLARNISVLRKALGEGSGGEKYIETITKRGYRFVAQVKRLSENSKDQVVVADEPQQSAAPRKAATTRRRLPRISHLYILPAAIVGCLLLAVAIILLTRGSAVGPLQTSIAVLPFKPLTEEDRDEALEIGMAEALINKLSTVPQLIVRPLGVVRRYTALNQDPLKAGREMGVDIVLESTMQKSTDYIRVTARLLRVSDGVALWSHRSDEPMSSILVLQGALSEKVAGSLVSKLGPEQLTLMKENYTQNAEAYELYLKGRFFFHKVTPEGVKKSISYFQQAIDKDPEFALAYCGMCASYTLFGHLRVLRPDEAFPAAKAALARALELDESLSEAHSQAGFIALHYDYEWARADKEFQRAIELNPNSPMAHHGRAFYLAAAGRTDEALLAIREALKLEPTSLHLNADAGRLYSLAQRPDDAIDQLRMALEMEPDFPLAALYLGRIYANKRMEKQAFEEFRKAAAPMGVPKHEEMRAAKVFAASGLSGYYRFVLDRLKAQLKERYVSPFDIARLYAVLGDRDHSIEWLKKAIEERNHAVPFLKVDPDFDNLRSDPRFSEILQKLKLQ